MHTTLTATCGIPGAGRVLTPRRADARLTPGGRDGPRERDTQVARTPLADQAARWQRILDLLDPDKRWRAIHTGQRAGHLAPRRPEEGGR